jgi:molybdopterin synthase sulfur carrier subunit
MFGHQLVEELFQIAARSRIGILHDQKAATGVVNKDGHRSVSHSAPPDLLLHFIRDFVQALTCGANFQLFMTYRHRIYTTKITFDRKLESRTTTTMKIHVQFYAQLRDLVGTGELDIDLDEDATVHDLLAKIYAQQPVLRPHDKSILIGAGVEFVDRNYKLKPGDEVAIMPPVQGG